MSNIVTVDLEIKDEEALLQAAARCGLVRKDAMHYKCYYRDSPKNACDFVLAVENDSHAYEIGVKRQGDKLVLAFDTHAGGCGLISRTMNVGHGPISKLEQFYAVAVASKELRRSGYRVREVTNEQGELVLLAS